MSPAHSRPSQSRPALRSRRWRRGMVLLLVVLLVALMSAVLAEIVFWSLTQESQAGAEWEAAQTRAALRCAVGLLRAEELAGLDHDRSATERIDLDDEPDAELTVGPSTVRIWVPTAPRTQVWAVLSPTADERADPDPDEVTEPLGVGQPGFGSASKIAAGKIAAGNAAAGKAAADRVRTALRAARRRADSPELKLRTNLPTEVYTPEALLAEPSDPRLLYGPSRRGEHLTALMGFDPPGSRGLLLEGRTGSTSRWAWLSVAPGPSGRVRVLAWRDLEGPLP